MVYYMADNKINFIVIIILIVLFTGSIYIIEPVYNGPYANEEEEQAYNKLTRFAAPTIALASFFIATYFVASIIQSGEYQFTGIYFMFFMGLILTILNNTVLTESKVKKYIRGKKFTTAGMIMTLGVGAIIFGFLDNFGLKLGTDALDTSFLNIFLSPFSVDTRFVKHKDNIGENLTYMNNWVNGKWRSVINQTLRFNKEIGSLESTYPEMKYLMEDINYFIREDSARPLNIPVEVVRKGLTTEYVRNIKDKFDMIDGSKAMLGNTFSDSIGAVLGAAIINLFIYMTSYDGGYTGDASVDDSFFVRNLNKYAPFMEAFFIGLGCLIPVFINIAMTRSDYNNNNMNSWLVIGVISAIVLVMMYLSVRGIKTMTADDKRNSLRKTMDDMTERLDITETTDADLKAKIDAFIGGLTAD